MLDLRVIRADVEQHRFEQCRDNQVLALCDEVEALRHALNETTELLTYYYWMVMDV